MPNVAWSPNASKVYQSIVSNAQVGSFGALPAADAVAQATSDDGKIDQMEAAAINAGLKLLIATPGEQVKAAAIDVFEKMGVAIDPEVKAAASGSSPVPAPAPSDPIDAANAVIGKTVAIAVTGGILGTGGSFPVAAMGFIGDQGGYLSADQAMNAAVQFVNASKTFVGAVVLEIQGRYFAYETDPFLREDGDGNVDSDAGYRPVAGPWNMISPIDGFGHLVQSLGEAPAAVTSPVPDP